MHLHAQPPSKLLLAPDPCMPQPELPSFLPATDNPTRTIWFPKAPEPEFFPFLLTSACAHCKPAYTKAKEDTYIMGLHEDSTPCSSSPPPLRVHSHVPSEISFTRVKVMALYDEWPPLQSLTPSFLRLRTARALPFNFIPHLLLKHSRAHPGSLFKTPWE